MMGTSEHARMKLLSMMGLHMTGNETVELRGSPKPPADSDAVDDDAKKEQWSMIMDNYNAW